MTNQKTKTKKSTLHRIVDASIVLVVIFLITIFLSQWLSGGVIVDYALPFPATEIGSWGFIDSTGKVVIPPQFNSGGEFHDGKAVVLAFDRNPRYLDRGKQITIDRTGRTIAASQRNSSMDGFRLPADFSKCGRFSDGVALAEYKGPSFRTVIDPLEKEKLLKAPGFHNFDEHNNLFVKVARRSALVDRSGRVVRILPGEPVRDQLDFSEGLVPLQIGERIGYVDTKGDVVIKPQFELARPFSEGMAAVRVGKWGSIDKTGQLVIPYTFDCIHAFHEGLVLGESYTSKNSGFFDKEGELKIPAELFRCTDFSEGLCAFSGNRFQKSGAFDHSGKFVFKLKSNGWLGGFHDGLCSAPETVNGRELYGYVDRHGNWAIKPQYWKVGNFSEGLASVCMYDPAKVKLEEENRKTWHRERMNKPPIE